MERIVEKGMLYDYYGQLLTERQRQIYEDAVYNDLSLSELADTYGISRQGVHDLLRRCDKTLAGYEEKLSCIRRDRELEKKLRGLLSTAQDRGDADTERSLAEALEILKGTS